LDPTDLTNSAVVSTTDGAYYAGAKAQYFQRLRVQTDFQVVEGLKLVTRFDALEKKWGDQTWNNASANGVATTAYPYESANRIASGGAVRVQENIEFERVYMDFNTAIGRFLVGYQEFGTFGTVFFDTSFTKPGAKYFIPAGPVTIMLAYDKQKEQEVPASWASPGGNAMDRDKDEYYIAAVYKKGNIEAGMLIEYLRDATTRSTATTSRQMKLWLIDPYFKGKFGPVFLETELIYGTGKIRAYDDAQTTVGDVDLSAWGFYLHARADISMFYFGGIFAAVSGDDPSSPDKVEGTIASSGGFLAGQNWSPTLIFKNDDHATQNGSLGGAVYGSSSVAGVTRGGAKWDGSSNATNQFMDNIWFYQLYFGVKPIPKLDIVAKISYAYADKKPWATPATLGTIGAVGDSNTEYNSNTYGTEVDLIATYKIYDNLQYMVGFGYFWTGDYYKGYYTASMAEPKLANDYLLMHKLTLTF